MQLVLQFLNQKVTLTFASESVLKALIELDNKNNNILDSFLLALEQRKKQSMDDSFDASISNAIALAESKSMLHTLVFCLGCK